MALDEPQQSDKKFDVDGIPILMAPNDEPYLTSYGDIFVDHVSGWSGTGFRLSQRFGSSC